MRIVNRSKKNKKKQKPVIYHLLAYVSRRVEAELHKAEKLNSATFLKFWKSTNSKGKVSKTA